MLGIDARNAKTQPLADTPQTATKANINYTYDGYPISSPKQDRAKIVKWFTTHLVLSNEQAVHELKIGNLSKRISELRKRHFLIYSQRHLAAFTGNVRTAYALHREMQVVTLIPRYLGTKTWLEKANSLLSHHPKFVDLNSVAVDAD